MRRISVIRNDKIVPLLPSKPINSNFRSPLSGLMLETHALGSVEVPEHEHASFCLTLQTGGPVDIEWWSEGKNGRESHRSGSMVLLTPGTRHRARFNQSSQQLLLSIDESYLLRAAQELGKKNQLAFANNWKFEDRQLCLLTTELQREMETGWETGSLYNEHLGMSLSIALIQKFNKDVTSYPLVKGGMSKARLQRVLEYVVANSHQDIRLTDLAEIADMSRFHFARLFRMQMGMTPHRYLIEQRLKQAKALLRLDTTSVAEIAIETGFTSPGHFSRAFRRYVGVSPTEWKGQL